MSREIKFRAWHNVAQEMDYPANASHALRWLEDGQDCVIEQYTGLKDKNGKMIFEGDIVKHGGMLGEVRGRTHDFVNEHDEHYSTSAGFDVYDPSDDTYSAFYEPIEVIGNIHENS